MFVRKVKVEILESHQTRACPLAWLDSFSMRNFTGRSAFDDTFPAGEGDLEVGLRVDLKALRGDMEDWMTRKFGAGESVHLRLTPR